MARLAAFLALLALAVAVAVAAEAPAASPVPSKPSILTPYAAAPPTSDAEAPSTDTFEDSEAAPIGAPASNYPPVDSDFDSKSSASSLGVCSAATASVAVAAGYFFF